MTLSLSLGVLLGGAIEGRSQVTVKVDSTQQWLGYVNVYQTNGTSYATGFAVPGTAVRGIFVPTNSPSGWPLNTLLILRPNISTYNTNDSYWNYSNGAPNKVMEANFYRDVSTAFAGQTVTFQGTVTTNNIPAPLNGPASGWQTVAFIKEFTTSYNFIGIESVPLTPGTPFSLSRPIAVGNVCQYGFYIFGPNTAPDSVNAMTGAGIVVEDADPAITVQPHAVTVTSGTTTNLTVTAVGSTALSYQWKRNNTNLINSGGISGVTTPTLVIANAQVSDTGPYSVTVTDNAGVATSVTVQVTVLDILINTAPVSQRVEQGSTVAFSVQASSSSPLTYQWKSVIGGVTNNLVNGPGVAGATNSSLTLSNVQVAQSGTYVVRISTGSQSADQSATLLVKTYAEYANFLENPGFEKDPTGADASPWIRFQATDPSFGSLQDSADTYFLGGNVNVYEGNYVSFTTFNADYSGIYQDVAASPGQIFAADMWFYNASGDPIPGPEFGAGVTNETLLEVQFRAGNAPTPIQQYVSSFLHYDTPKDVWINLQATNAGGYGTMPPTSNAQYLVAPPGTTTVRFQVTLHDISGSIGNGSVYYDSARLMLKVPATVGGSQSGGNVVLTWKSQGATSYQIQYRDGLADTWHNLEVVAGTGLVITKSYAPSGDQRFYRVLTL